MNGARRAVGYVARRDAAAAERALRSTAELIGMELAEVFAEPAEDSEVPLSQRWVLLKATDAVASGSATVLLTDNDSLLPATRPQISDLASGLTAGGGRLMVVTLILADSLLGAEEVRRDAA